MAAPPNFIALQVDEQGSAQIAGDLGLSLTQGTFSLSTWIQYDAFSSNAAIVEREGEFLFRAMDNGFFFQISGRPPVVWRSPEALNDGWYNICVTYDQGTARLYVDGEFKQLASIGSSGATSSKPLVIGSGLQGLITDVVIYNQALSATQVMDAQFTDLDSSLVAAHFDFSQNPPVDKGPKALPISLTSGANPVLVTPGLHMESTGYAYPMRDGDINPGGQHVDPYSVQAWVYMDRSMPDQNILVNSDLNAGTGMALKLVHDDSQDKIFLVSRRGSTQGGPSVTSSVEIPMQTWTNVATTFDGETLTVYVNGSAVGSMACGPIPLSRPFGEVIIGATFSETGVGGVHTFQGYLSRVEIWNIALSAAQIDQYQGEFPSPTVEGLVASFDLASAPVRNNVSGHPVGLAGGAHLYHQIGDAPSSTRDERRSRIIDEPTVGAEKLAEWRTSVDHSSFLAEHGHLLDDACAADLQKFDDAASQEKIRTAYDDVKRRLAVGAGPEMPLTFTRHEENGRRYLVGHDRRGSYVAHEADVSEIDDCTLWKIQLVFVVVAGALDAIVGVRAYLSANGTRLIRSILLNPRVVAIMAAGIKITASSLFVLMGVMFSAGILRSLIWAIVDLGFWALIRIVAKALLTFAGVGAADVIASLIATVAIFIKTVLERPVSCDPLPALTLAAIKFNHDPTHSAVDALSIRVNATTPIDVPEWRLGHTVASQSPAAYAMDQVSGKTVTIQAKFTIDTSDAVSLQIQATGGGILGAIDPVTVNFLHGVSSPDYVTFNVPHHKLSGGGIQAVDAQWNWQYKIGAHDWTATATSNHRIFTLLTKPAMPWMQRSDPLESQLPWVQALEYACSWASGKTNETDALTEITKKVNTAYGLKYDTSQGASFYTATDPSKGKVFLLTSFLVKLGGGTGLGPIVNCTDCATIVTTFANLTGCNIQASVMGHLGFYLNKVIAIGFTGWAYPFPTSGRGHFSYHEVAWTGATAYRDHIFDACLQLDSSDDPWNWAAGTSHTAAYPVNFQFTGQMLPTTLPIATPFTPQTYRERLATNTADGITACSPSGQWPHTQSGRRYVV